MQPTPVESFPAPALLIMRSSRQEITVSISVALLIKSKSTVAFKTIGQKQVVTEFNADLHLVRPLEIKFLQRHMGCISFSFSRDTKGWHVWIVKGEAPGAHLLLLSPMPCLSYCESDACILYSSLVWHRNPDSGRHCHITSEKIQEGASVVSLQAMFVFVLNCSKGQGRAF